MGRPLLILLFVILLPAFFSAADPQEAPSPPLQVEVELKGQETIKLGERGNFTLLINNPHENIFDIRIVIEIPKCLEIKEKISGNLTEYLVNKPTISESILVCKAKNLNRGNYSLEFELEPKCVRLGGVYISNAIINAIVEYYIDGQQEPETKSISKSVEVKKPYLLISNIECLLSIERDCVETTWNITIKNNEASNIFNVDVTCKCKPESELSCPEPWHGSLISGENNIRFNVNVTGGLESLKRGENLTLTFIVSYGDCNITNGTAKVPLVLPELSVGRTGLKVNISSREEGFSLSNVFFDEAFRKWIIRESVPRRLSEGENILLTIDAVDESILDLQNGMRGVLCANGSLNNITFEIRRTYDIRELKIEKNLPYLIVVKGVDGDAEVRVNGKSDYPLLKMHLGNDMLLILLQDMFVPGFHEANITIFYLKKGDVELRYGIIYRYPILGGVGTLALLLLAVLFVLAMRARRRVERIPAKWGVEAPEHVELG